MIPGVAGRLRSGEVHVKLSFTPRRIQFTVQRRIVTVKARALSSVHGS